MCSATRAGMMLNRPPTDTLPCCPPSTPFPCPVLDMVTDRVATTCLLAVLGAVYPATGLLPALLLIMLDIGRWAGGWLMGSVGLLHPAAATCGGSLRCLA